MKSTEPNHSPFWVAIDWGSTNLRYWVISKATNQIIETDLKQQGIKLILGGNFETVLSQFLSTHLSRKEVTQVLCCGMIGSKQGWYETEYVRSPCSPQLSKNLVQAVTKDTRLDVWIIPGIMQEESPDIMRGEETQILGFLSSFPDFEGVICLTGTHTKWVKISGGEVIFFETFMTGEMFDLLSNHSMLKFSISSEKIDINESQSAALEIFTSPYKFSANLFKLRANDLLNGASPAIIRSRLSGYTIGLEIAGSKKFWLGNEVVLVGNNTVTAIYKAVLEEQGIKPKVCLSDELSLNGLKATYKKFFIGGENVLNVFP